MKQGWKILLLGTVAAAAGTLAYRYYTNQRNQLPEPIVPEDDFAYILEDQIMFQE